MVLSMTGYGRAGALLHGRDIKVELRSVNARFFEYSSRLPRSCAFLEDKLKKLVASRVSRGKVELSLSIQTVTAADTVVSVNWQLAEGYRAALNEMVERMDLKNDVSVGMLSRFPDVLTQTAAPTNEEELWQDVQSVAEKAVDAFVAMRAVEGEKLKEDVAAASMPSRRWSARSRKTAQAVCRLTAISSTSACRNCWATATSTKAALLLRLPSLPIRPLSMRRPSACTAMWPSTARSWPWMNPSVVSWTF